MESYHEERMREAAREYNAGLTQMSEMIDNLETRVDCGEQELGEGVPHAAIGG